MGIGPLCNHGCRVLFEEAAVTVFSKDNTVLPKGYREKFGDKPWHFSLRPKNTVLQQCSTGPISLNADDIPSVGTLVPYLHAAAGFPVKSTLLTASKAGNYASWPDLTSANASKYCPVPIETLQGHIKQSRK